MLSSNSNYATHTPSTSSPFHKPKAHYVQLEDLQEKNLEGEKKQKLVNPAGTTSFYTHTIAWQQSWQRHVFVLMNEFQSLHKAMIAATSPHKHTPWPRAAHQPTSCP
jgi:hypothetical protein